MSSSRILQFEPLSQMLGSFLEFFLFAMKDIIEKIAEDDAENSLKSDCKKAHFTHFESSMLHLNFLFEMTLIINSNPNWHCSLYYPLPNILCKNESSKLPKCCHFTQVKCQILMPCKSILISKKKLIAKYSTKKWPPGDKE